MLDGNQQLGRLTSCAENVKDVDFTSVFVGLDTFLSENGLHNPLHFYDLMKFRVFKL